MLNIQPLKLLRGHHADTGTTGSGCLLDVVSYLAGDAAVTDLPKCVCPVLRPILQRINDMFDDKERPLLLPYVERIMLTSGAERKTMIARARNSEILGHRLLRAAFLDAPDPMGQAFWLRMYDVNYAEFLVQISPVIDAAVKDMDMGFSARRVEEIVLGYLDHVLPHDRAAPAPAPQVLERAKRLVELATGQV